MCRNPEATRAMGTRAKEAFHVNTPHTPLPLRWNAAAATVVWTAEDGWQKGANFVWISNETHSKLCTKESSSFVLTRHANGTRCDVGQEDREKPTEFFGKSKNHRSVASVRSMVKATHVLGITLLVCCILQASFLTGARRVLFVAQHAHCFSCVCAFRGHCARNTYGARRLALRPVHPRCACPRC